MIDYFESFLTKKNLTPNLIESKMKFTDKVIDGTDSVCHYLHSLPRTTNIGIISDYDCDGLLSEVNKYLGLNLIGFTNIFIAQRDIKRGYELTLEDIDNLGDIEVLITSDVGINCFEAVSHAKHKGITVIVTDHHIPENMDRLEADYVINYRLDIEFLSENTDICGAYTIYHLFNRYFTLFADEYMDIAPYHNELHLMRHFAAIATIADSVPLVSINHFIAKDMLHFMSYINPINKNNDIVQGVCYSGILQNVYNNFHTFISNLINDSYTSFDMQFLMYSVIPTINVIKRMELDPMMFYEMMFGESSTAASIAQLLIMKNTQRKQLIEEKYKELTGETLENGAIYNQPYGSLIFKTSAPTSVAGLLAITMYNANHLPCVVLNDSIIITSQGKHVYKGSVRSPKEFDFLSSINQSGLATCRGHEHACGIEVPVENLDALFSFIENAIKTYNVGAKDVPKSEVDLIEEYDIYINYDENLYDFEEDIEKLMENLSSYGPFGVDFDEPKILLRFSQKHGGYIKLKDGLHTKINLSPSISCLIWNTSVNDLIKENSSEHVFLTGSFSKSLYQGEWTTNFIAQTIQ